MVYKLLALSFLFIFSMNASIFSERLKYLAEEAKTWEEGHPYSSFKYPAQAEQIIKQFPEGKVLVFGYGSLVNPESAARTLSPEAMKTYQPAVAFGMKRIFNRKVTNTDRWGPRERESDVGMLNIFKTGNRLDALNGVTFEVNQADLSALIQRETGYDLVPIPVVNWQEAISDQAPNFHIAYAFLSPEEARQGKVFVDPCVNPVPGYARASKEGAALNGKGFLMLWLESTFLADKTTPFIQWEHNSDATDMAEKCLKKINR